MARGRNEANALEIAMRKVASIAVLVSMFGPLSAADFDQKSGLGVPVTHAPYVAASVDTTFPLTITAEPAGCPVNGDPKPGCTQIKEYHSSGPVLDQITTDPRLKRMNQGKNYQVTARQYSDWNFRATRRVDALGRDTNMVNVSVQTLSPWRNPKPTKGFYVSLVRSGQVIFLQKSAVTYKCKRSVQTKVAPFSIPNDIFAAMTDVRVVAVTDKFYLCP